MVKKRAKNEKLPARRAGSGPAPTKLLRDLRDLIQSTRTGLAQAVNSALVLLYWQVGQRIRSDVLKSRRAGPPTGMRFVRHCQTNWRWSSGMAIRAPT